MWRRWYGETHPNGCFQRILQDIAEQYPLYLHSRDYYKPQCNCGLQIFIVCFAYDVSVTILVSEKCCKDTDGF